MFLQCISPLCQTPPLSLMGCQKCWTQGRCLQVPFHTGATVAFGRQYYAFMQYSRFVRHGYAILESSLPELALVAASPACDARRRYVVVVSNPLPKEEVRVQSSMGFEEQKCDPSCWDVHSSNHLGRSLRATWVYK